MVNNEITLRGRQPKFKDECPNKLIAEWLAERKIKNKDFAKLINEAFAKKCKEGETPCKFTVEAVRQWVEGYARPSLSTIPILADVMRCSADYLLGIDIMPTKEEEEVFNAFSLSPKASANLNKMRYGKQDYSEGIALCFLSDLLESECLTELAGNYSRWKEYTQKIISNDKEGPEVIKMWKDFTQRSEYFAEKTFGNFFDETKERMRKEFLESSSVSSEVTKKEKHLKNDIVVEITTENGSSERE